MRRLLGFLKVKITAMSDMSNSKISSLSVASHDDDEIDLTALLSTIWRGKMLVIIAAVIGLVLGIIYAFFMATPVYTSSAVVMLESRQEQVVDLESVMTGIGGDQVAINTEVEVIRSRGLIEKLVNQLNLIEDPEFNTSLQSKPLLSPGRLISGIKGLFSSAEGPQSSERELLDATIDRVLDTISVSNVRQSYVFRITATTESPQKSAEIANTLSELYILEQIEVKFDATEKATEWLTDRVGQLQIELEEAVTAVKEFNAGTELISAETLAGLNRQLKETRDRLREATASLAASEQRIANLNAARAAGDMQKMADLAADNTLTQLILRSETPDRTVFEARFDQVIQRAEVDLARISNQITALENSIVTQEGQIERQSADLVTLQQLEREAEANRLIYEYFLNRLKETSIQQGIQQADSRILSLAVVPLSPSAPRKSMVMALMLILGLMVGVAIVVGREMAQNTFRLGEDLENKTGYPVLGQIPSIPARNRSNVLKYLSDKPTSAAAEAVRNLRTSVLLSDLDNPPQIIMSTSSVPGEGKTTQSLALTQNLAKMGKKVLLIEGDMRKRVFAEYFDLKDQNGLMSVLSGETPFNAAIFKEPSLHADLLVAEKTSTNPADVYSSERFRSFLTELRAEYDYIIIDTPPVLAVPDARVIGQHVDAILYTVRWDSTSQRQVRDGIRSFEGVNLKISGLVLGQISDKGMKRYGYGSGYGDYSSYYDN